MYPVLSQQKPINPFKTERKKKKTIYIRFCWDTGAMAFNVQCVDVELLN